MQDKLSSEKTEIIITDDLAERGLAGYAQHAAFLFETSKMSSSPYINRFLNADTIVPNPANPQNLNRYSYVRNNPVKYIDPSGHGVDCGIGMGCVGDYIPPSNGNSPAPAPNNNNNHHDDDDEDEGIMEYCSTHPGACGLPPAAPPVVTPPTVTLPPYYPDFDDVLSDYPSSVTLHPSDYLIGPPVVGFVPYYSSDGTVIGYFEIVNQGPVSVNPPANGAITALEGLVMSMAATGLEALGYCGGVPICTYGVWGITAIDIANQSIVIEADPQVGVMVPVHPVPYPELPDMPSPFPSYH